ncbi:MAG: hypothetical protein QNK35_15920, partial [Bacteroides sp.]|nr:hypothetical protein [Bacteroides sp.]
MKTQKLLSILLTGLFIIGIAIPMQAQETDESINIFKPTGAKETAKDFTPAPDKINTSYGTLEFVGG